ncbi:MAG: hypothetical protein HKN17_02665, partial [Rhodothermales bacterium]|nr:hypothetical protein [Rhodothermales bacterium]
MRKSVLRAVDADDIPRFHSGRMWTFHNPPLEYLEESYGFRPDSSWLARARQGAVRFASYCSASFVSPNGLLVT